MDATATPVLIQIINEGTSAWPMIVAGLIAALAAVGASFATGVLAYKAGQRSIDHLVAQSRTNRLAEAQSVVLVSVRRTLAQYVTRWGEGVVAIGALVQTGNTPAALEAMSRTGKVEFEARTALDIEVNQLDDAELRDSINRVADRTTAPTGALMQILGESGTRDLDRLSAWHQLATEAGRTLRSDVVEINRAIIERIADIRPSS